MYPRSQFGGVYGRVTIFLRSSSHHALKSFSFYSYHHDLVIHYVAESNLPVL
jgi:hypothetical protein